MSHEENRTFKVLDGLSEQNRQAVMITSFLLQSHIVLKYDSNFLKPILGDDDEVKHSQIIEYARLQAEFKNNRDYFNFKNEIFDMDPLMERVELDVALNLALKEFKPFEDYDRDFLMERIIKHDVPVEKRNGSNKLMAIANALRERSYLKTISKFTDIDFKQEIIVACSQINLEKYRHDKAFYSTKAGLIYNYTKMFLRSPKIAKILEEDPYYVTKYFLANTNQILMENMRYAEKDALGIFEAHKKKSPEIKLGLDLDEDTSVKTSEDVPIPSAATGGFDDIDSLLASFEKK